MLTDLSQNNNSTLFPIIPTARTLQRSSLASSAKSIDVIREEEVNNVKAPFQNKEGIPVVLFENFRMKTTTTCS